MNDPIVEEVRRARAVHAEAFDYDLQAIFADMRQKQEASGRSVVSFPAKRPSNAELATTRAKETQAQE